MIASLFTSFIATKLGAKLPPWLWEILLLALLIGAGMLVHHVQVVRHDNGVRAEQKAADDTAAKAAVAKLNATITNLTTALRKATDEKNRTIAADAGTLRMSGPGKAVCPRLPAASGGHVESPAKPDAAGPALPPADFAAVPWNWLVSRAQEHDELIAEDQAWRDWYAQVVKVWPKTGAAAK